MDATASSIETDKLNKQYDFFIKIEDAYPTAVKQRSTVMKYTKLPNLDFDTNVSWPQHSSYSLPPRLRRIIAFDDAVDIKTSRSLKTEVGQQPKNNSNLKNRKIATIAEDDESDNLSCSYQAPLIESNQYKQVSRAVSTRKDYKSFSAKSTTNSINSEPLPNRLFKKNLDNKEKDTPKVNKLRNTTPKIPVRKSTKDDTGNMIEFNLIKNKLMGNLQLNPVPSKSRSPVTSFVKISKPVPPKTTLPAKTPSPKTQPPQPIQSKQKKLPLPEKKSLKTTITRILVPRAPLIKKNDTPRPVNKNEIEVEHKNELENKIEITEIKSVKPEMVDSGTEIDTKSVDIMIATDPEPTKVDRGTDIVTHYESLEIPNVTLTKDNSDISKDLIEFCSRSLPNLDVPSLKVAPEKKNRIRKDNMRNSCIIGQATVTYTTQQKINFHVVGSKSHSTSNLPSLSYPINAVSVYKKEIENRGIRNVTRFDSKRREKDRTNEELKNRVHEMASIDFPMVFEDNELIKPSEIISTININKGLLQNDNISEQFQRELNFIDSFFESLQYLENCSLSHKLFKDNKVENWVSKSGININSPEYNYFFSKIENAVVNEDSETMASKSLCLLNLLIRDEQRRAKNLLVVLKMREDALKDFTKSQILWLENKKRQDNTDISTLKKKQRGALLRLQHECGEMQRMRKALLSLSEKRKLALMKTKKNIELKIKNNVSVNQIVLNKKKIKKGVGFDRNIAPLKCFDLSSSGCDESLAARSKSDSNIITSKVAHVVTSAEKSIQTSDRSFETVTVTHSTETVNDTHVSVDGTFLNILFHQLSLPQIFSNGKNYEVDTEALKNIVNSSNTRQVQFDNGDVEKLMDKVKNREVDKSSTPSTARSLVEELDQYYKGLAEEASSQSDLSVQCNDNEDYEGDVQNRYMSDSASEVKVDEQCECTSSMISLESKLALEQRLVCTMSETHPPASAPASDPASAPLSELSSESARTASTSSLESANDTSLSPSVCNISPVHTEAEELRRQQLAIEREILALEQQQNQLLVVREIPDKPPPPYTPPVDTRTVASVPIYQVTHNVEQQIHRLITGDSHKTNTNDPFEIFVNDYCKDAIEKENYERSNRPWDACYLLPQKRQTNLNQLANKTSSELREVLAGAVPNVVTGVGARRSDHIDDILFTEWRRCEPEWTALQVEEISVKNLIFESIFQKVLSDTIDEYKIIVPCAARDAFHRL